MLNVNLNNAKKAKNDEFYTEYNDIVTEINAYLDYNPNLFKNKIVLLPCDDPEFSNFTKYFVNNFRNFGIKKLISTSYAKCVIEYRKHFQLSFFEDNEKYNYAKNDLQGRIFILTEEDNDNIDINNLSWRYLIDNGDFRSDEVKKLRDETDIIITNPPFSLFREFVDWIFEAKKEFLIIGNVNSIGYKKIFNLIKNKEVWLGHSRADKFKTLGDKNVTLKLRDLIRWFTNIKYAKERQPLKLMTIHDNMKFSKHKKIKDTGYQKYDNYDVLEIPYTDAIPSDYDGVMGVPITFLDKYNPEQFELLDIKNDCLLENKFLFKRIFIQKIS